MLQPANYIASEVKASVDLASYIISTGTDLAAQSNGQYVGLCPFHDDQTPSLNVYQNETGQRWTCWAGCGYGDIFDFAKRLYGLTFPAALKQVVEARDSGGLPIPPESVATFHQDPSVFQDILDKAAGNNTVLPDLVVERQIKAPISWIRNEWLVKDNNAFVFIPHYDIDSNLIGIKRRWQRDWTPIADYGSDLSNLYGIWKGSLQDRVIICEGESDTWYVSYLMRDEPVTVLGLPHGARGPTPDWVNALAGHHLTLLFDADNAGRKALKAWGESRLDVHIAVLPDGSDCNTAGEAATRKALGEARVWVDIVGLPLFISNGRYAYLNQQGQPVILSDFVLEPRRLLLMDDNVHIEVTVEGKEHPQLLSGDDLSSTSRFRSWTTKRLLSWKGTDRNISDLIELLKAQCVTIPQVHGVDVLGLHDKVFVLPDCSIGASGWGYVAPENDVHLDESLRIKSGPWDSAVVSYLAQMHDARVMTPILGWVAAAPLRSLFRQFPILAVTGGAGWGKSTIVRWVLESFGFWTKTAITLTGSTPHAILSYASSTNAFPVWVDEYRPGQRPDTRMALDQVIRDAWDGASTIKGGLYESRMKIKSMPSCAPLVVSGEDAFSETSHIERMVLVEVPKEGKNTDALSQLERRPSEGLGLAYLTWIIDQLRADNLPSIPNLHSRPEQAIATAEWGYELLQTFIEDTTSTRLTPDFDGSACVAYQRESQRRPVILEAIDLAAGLQDSNDEYIVYIDSTGDGYIKPQALVRWVQNHSDIKLPGGSKAISRWLAESYGAQSIRHPIHGRCLKVSNLQRIIGDD